MWYSQDSDQHPIGHFEFSVMGFGLTNAPATFSMMMNNILRPFLRKSVVDFLDDMLIYSRTLEEHVRHVREVLQTLRKNKLFCKPAKCVFGAGSVKFLGYVVSGFSLAPDEEKVAAVKNWPVPRTVSEIRRFLGFANFFRRFIKNYSDVARPLEELTGWHTRFTWSPSCQVAFDRSKGLLLSAPVLKLADASKPFRVITDASDCAVGGVYFYRKRKLVSGILLPTLPGDCLLRRVTIMLWSARHWLWFMLFTCGSCILYNSCEV